MKTATLYIVATPIGNMEDLTLRALRILGEVDFILCEDTRVTKKLLNHYKIKTPTISFHQHSDQKKLTEIIKLLTNGKSLALVTDAGTPGISDPGGKLVAAALKSLEQDVKIESIPGPSALTAALSISGIATDKFVFLGFPPHKKGRQKFITNIAKSVYPVVIYESKHRIIKFLQELILLNKQIEEKNKQIEARNKHLPRREQQPKLIPMTSVVVCRELSKMHETVYRGDLQEILTRIKENKDDQKGEFVVVVGK